MQFDYLNKKRICGGIFIHHEKENRQTKCQLVENIKLFDEGKSNHRCTIILMRVDVLCREAGTKQTVRRSSSVATQARGNPVWASGAQVQTSEQGYAMKNKENKRYR